MLMLDVVGLTEQEAISNIKKFCFNDYVSYSISYEVNNDIEEGVVIRTKPAANEKYNSDDIIHIVLARHEY